MPRTEVYQLRLTKAEKAALAHEAKKRGISIARMIRTDYGLLEVRDAIEDLADMAVEDPEGVRFAYLTRQLKSQGYTTPVAERMARKQLGT